MEKAKQCLLIDDDLDDQEIFMMCLKNINPGILCKTANDGSEALSVLASNEEFCPEFIFIDVNMPKMNGIDCLKEIKKIERLKNSRIFMYSTTSEKDVEIESKNLGADDFIIKSAKTRELKEKLGKIFRIVSVIKN